MTPSLVRRLAWRDLSVGLRRNTSGLALIEFAFSLPLVLGIGLYGVETANLALANLRVSQIALNLADNASRVGVRSMLATQQLREIDINDVLEATRLQGQSIELTTRGRVILSSLENPGDTGQRIHWQRCIGLRSGAPYESNSRWTSTADGTNQNASNDGREMPGGMGDPGSMVLAPPDSGVMFVEINYDYKPVVGTAWLPGGSAIIRYTASFIVRDRRDFRQIYNPAPAVSGAQRKTCNRYSAA